MKALEQNFEKERKKNVHYFKSIETENKDLKGKLWDFKIGSQQDNLRFDGMVEYENESWTDNEEKVEQRVRTEWAQVIGKPKDDGLRTTVAKFHSFFMIF